MSAVSLALVLTPRGHLLLAHSEDEAPAPEQMAQHLTGAFARGAGHGLLHLGARAMGTALPPSLAWWREFGARYVTAVCHVAPAAEGSAGTLGTAPGTNPVSPDALPQSCKCEQPSMC